MRCVLSDTSGSYRRLRHAVETDESVRTKRKHNSGHAISSQYAFGSIDRDIDKCFTVLVERRDTAADC